jgi:hypothetical protein
MLQSAPCELTLCIRYRLRKTQNRNNIPLASGKSRQGRNNVAHRGSGGNVSAFGAKPRRGGTWLASIYRTLLWTAGLFGAFTVGGVPVFRRKSNPPETGGGLIEYDAYSDLPFGILR